jgi:hypothetical protein
VVAAFVLAPQAAAVSGQMRVLYVLATWGPRPFSVAQTQRVADETDAFFRASSAGRFAMPGAVADWITLERSIFDLCSATALRLETPTALLAGYDRVAFVTPQVSRCQFAGEADPSEVLLNGFLTRPLAVHELGHTLGLGHASSYLCESGSCDIEEYGSLFSTMGGGSGDFNAYEKRQLDWLTSFLRAERNGAYEIGPVEGPTTLPQALVVATARNEYWFESRSLPTPSFNGTQVQPPGVVAVVGPASAESSYPRDNLLLPNPNGSGRYAYGAGESFVEPGAFRLTVAAHSANASLQFEWTDRTRPTRPLLRAAAFRGGRARLEWDAPVERGSGLASYSLLVDGRVVRQVDPIAYSSVLRVGRGRHVVGIAATDRAGNRGPAATIRLRLR